MNAVQTRFWAVRDYFAPVLRESRFEQGRITPEEFVIAGNHLAKSFPAWEWCSGDQKRVRDFLPRDKQYLVSRSVPCFRRISQMIPRQRRRMRSWASASTGNSRFSSPRRRSVQYESSDVLVQEDSGDWMVLHSDFGEDSIHSAEPSGRPNRYDRLSPPPRGVPDLDVDVDVDLAEFSMEMHEPHDAAQLHLGSPTERTHSSSPTRSVSPSSSRTSMMRSYDCIITYDKYYQTPRMWLIGYDYSGIPLTPTQIFEDVASEHVHRTVTIEPFPHGVPLAERVEFPNAPELSASVATIHPCKHANVMQKLIEHINTSALEKSQDTGVQESQGISFVGRMMGWGPSAPRGVTVEQYLVIFLKLMASIVPTIEIDATQAV
ncbi:E2-like enzyme [Malassezia cuniculi]|uniref:Autophagy-related protein 3 n=1 Tax=Malassezia cuniculi TaxID=948313 RepID=A0AAF0J647_9BASI|nr:E2-like enzyme [Malassezia cuniculi]